MKRSRDSFTLIEMLVVISVIAILAGLSFKLVQISKRNADRAATVAKLEKVAHALNEFKAEYGTYPPVNSVEYEYEDTNKQDAAVFMELNTESGREKGTLFRMGLVSYLEKRDRDGIYHKEHKDWVPDTDRDELAKDRWSIFIEGVVQDGSAQSNNLSIGGGSAGAYYENSVRTIKDAWGKVIKYECDPPYLSYRLWSDGPTADPSDDIHKDTWDN